MFAGKLRYLYKLRASITQVSGKITHEEEISTDISPTDKKALINIALLPKINTTPFLESSKMGPRFIQSRGYKPSISDPDNFPEKVYLDSKGNDKDLKPIQIIRGEYALHHKLSEDEENELERNPAEFYKHYLEAVIGNKPLPAQSFIIIVSPTKYTQNDYIFRGIEPNHAFGFATDEEGNPIIKTHIDFYNRFRKIEGKPICFKPIIGYNHRNGSYEAELKDHQFVWKGVYVTHKERCKREIKEIKKYHSIQAYTKKVAVVILPDFDRKAREKIKKYVEDMIGEDQYNKLDNFEEVIIDAPKYQYILGGGFICSDNSKPVFVKGEKCYLRSASRSKRTLDDKLKIYPNNCATTLFYGAKAEHDYWLEKMEKLVNFEEELFSAFPINAVVLLIEQRYGYKVASAAAMILAKEPQFNDNLQLSRYATALSTSVVAKQKPIQTPELR